MKKIHLRLIFVLTLLLNSNHRKEPCPIKPDEDGQTIIYHVWTYEQIPAIYRIFFLSGLLPMHNGSAIVETKNHQRGDVTPSTSGITG